MTNDSENDVHRVWENQPRDPQRISLDAIHANAQRLETRTQRWRIVGATLMILLVISNTVEAVWPRQSILERTGDLLTVAALVYISYQYRKYARIASRPDARGVTNCVEFYRAHLTYERNLARQSSRYLLPFVPGVALSILHGVFEDGLPTARLIGFAALGVALFLGVAWWNVHTARKLQREIDALDVR